MNKTSTETITPGGIPANPGNPPFSEAGLKDSGGGQSLQVVIDGNLINTDENQNISSKSAWKEINKKRLRTSPEEKIKAKQTKMDYWLNPAIETSNKYSLLNTDEDITHESLPETLDPLDNAERQTKPPPIFVAGVGDINPLYGLLGDVAPFKYILRVINSTEVKIQAKTIEDYDKIVLALRSINIEFHSYQKKQDKAFKVKKYAQYG